MDLHIETAWDRPAMSRRPEKTDAMRHLRIALRASGAGPGLPLDVALVLDSSSSMRIDQRLERAKQACLLLAAALRPEDRLSLASFDRRVRRLCFAVPGGQAAAVARTAFETVDPGEGTRLDHALDWLLEVLPPQPDRRPRLAVLVTDGQPSDDNRRIIHDMAPFQARARALGRAGVILHAIGLGPARNFNAPVLHALGRDAFGGFTHAETADALGAQLADLLQPAQSVVAADGVLLLRALREGVKVLRVARVRPSLLPLRADSAAVSEVEMSLGPVEGVIANTYIAQVEMPPLGWAERAGEVAALEVTAEAGSARSTQAVSFRYVTPRETDWLDRVNNAVFRDAALMEAEWQPHKQAEAGSATRALDPDAIAAALSRLTGRLPDLGGGR